MAEQKSGADSAADKLKQLNAMLQKAKGDWASFGSDIAKDVLVSGDASAGMIYNGFGAKARGENGDLEYAYPKEGYVFWMDNVVLLKDAPNRENALKFMDFLLEPENIAAVSNYAQYNAGVTGVAEFLEPWLATMPENNPREGAGAGAFSIQCEAFEGSDSGPAPGAREPPRSWAVQPPGGDFFISANAE